MNRSCLRDAGHFWLVKSPVSALTVVTALAFSFSQPAKSATSYVNATLTQGYACVDGTSMCNYASPLQDNGSTTPINEIRSASVLGPDGLSALVNTQLVATFGQLRFVGIVNVSTTEYRYNLSHGEDLGGVVSGDVAFQDYLIVDGPAGGSTVLNISDQLDYTLSGCGSIAGETVNGCQIYSQLTVGNASVFAGHSSQITVANGSMIPIYGELDGAVNLGGLPVPNDATNFPDFVNYTNQLDAGHTNNFYIDDLTAGSTVTSVSGHSYSTPTITPVPEPATTVLITIPSLLLMASRFQGGRRRNGCLIDRH